MGSSIVFIKTKLKSRLRRRFIAMLLACCLVGSPILIAQNAQAISATYLKYIKQAQKILALIKGGGLGSLDFGNLGDFLSLFKDIPIEELQEVLKDIQDEIDSIDPMTKELIGSISSTLGDLGLPIPSEVNKLLSSISEKNPEGFNSPFGLSDDQGLMAALGISSDAVANSVLGKNGQENIAKNLSESETAWKTGSDIIQTNGTAMVSDSVTTAIEAQFSFSSQEVLKAIAIQNAQGAALNQQLGASNAEQGKIQAMGVNLAAKNLAVDAQALKVESFQAKTMAAEANARQADTQGAFTGAMINAYMWSCLSTTDCK